MAINSSLNTSLVTCHKFWCIFVFIQFKILCMHTWEDLHFAFVEWHALKTSIRSICMIAFLVFYIFIGFPSTYSFFFNFFLNIYLFLRDRKRQSASREGAEREGDTESKADSRLWASCQHRARCGARTYKPWDHDLRRSRTLNQLSHTGAPLLILFVTKRRVLKFQL